MLNLLRKGRLNEHMTFCLRAKLTSSACGDAVLLSVFERGLVLTWEHSAQVRRRISEVECRTVPLLVLATNTRAHPVTELENGNMRRVM